MGETRVEVGVSIRVQDDTPSDKGNFINRGDDQEQLDRFQKLTRALTDCHLRIKQHRGEAIGPLVSEPEVKDIEKLAALTSAGLTLEQVPADRTSGDAGGWQIRRSKDGYHLTLGDKLSAKQSAVDLKENAKLSSIERKPGALRGHIEKEMLGEYCRRALDGLDLGAALSTSEYLDITMGIRSTEGVIAYLGELMRATLKQGGPMFYETAKNSRATLFNARHGSWAEDNVLVKVRYHGETYMIDSPESPDHASRRSKDFIDYTSYTLDFVTLLLGLTKNSKDLPKTGAVEVVGP